MTELDFSLLMSKLSSAAKDLNKESDSLNDVIRSFEERLRSLNLGVEAWVTSAPLDSELLEEEWDGGYGETGRIVQELGFGKIFGEWRLLVRKATYRWDPQSGGPHEGSLDFDTADRGVPLHECSRDVRIEALKRFPQLVLRLNDRAADALAAISTAKKFVN